ncbi:MAG TPA: PP2C family protein-serine/threonine phosphatase [Tepidisphaeraceae bacterium]|nr:PP2C family protein-serine/threonine phosphatase [Tepidisphaeraceae bacterium]
MAGDDKQFMQCMEVWGGSQLTERGVQLGGLDAWVYSKPFGNAGRGGDVYYASSCATGRISRLLLADVSGHGDAVAATAAGLRTLMRRYVNFLDQTKLVRSMNRQFAAMSGEGCFATAVATTFFSPTRTLSVCNAGHPRPLLYRAGSGKWSILEKSHDAERSTRNIPLGILDITDYEQFAVELEVGDLVLCYTDALIESRNSDGEFLGEEGLRDIAASMDLEPVETFIQSLLSKITERHDGNLLQDDVTALLLRPNSHRPRIRRRDKLGAALRLMGATIRGINPHAERPPLPDLNLANIGGAIFPRLAKRWRPAHPLGASRPPRQSIP